MKKMRKIRYFERIILKLGIFSRNTNPPSLVYIQYVFSNLVKFFVETKSNRKSIIQL